MDGRPERFPSTVPARAQQDGEAAARRERWAWAEPGVWTDRMLAALEQGVQGGVWFRLSWPNAFFAAQGLYSMAAAHALAGQPARR